MVSVLCWFWNANNSFNDGSTMGGSKCFNIQLVYCFNKPKTFSSELFDFGLGFGVDLGLVQFLFSFCCLLSGLDLNWFCIDYGLVWFGLVWFGLVWFGLVWFGFGLCFVVGLDLE